MTLKDMYLLLQTTYGHNDLWLMLHSPTGQGRSTYLDGSYVASPGRILCRYSQGRWIHSVKTDFRHFDPLVDRSISKRTQIVSAVRYHANKSVMSEILSIL